MLGNPYSSTEPGLGPLMRDVKNKICQDCELVALLEDDNGMELLVNNKIISLDLPVREVCIHQLFSVEVGSYVFL
jgi:E3 ubiquitin-protein ligase UBR4